MNGSDLILIESDIRSVSYYAIETPGSWPFFLSHEKNLVIIAQWKLQALFLIKH